MEKMHSTQLQPKKMSKISQFDVAPLCLSPLLACDLGLPEILINVSCFPTLTCPTPVLTLTISQPTVPHTSSWNSSSWAESYFQMFNNSTYPPPPNTLPQTSLQFRIVSQTTNALQISKRQNSIQSVSTPPKSLFRQELGHEWFQFSLSLIPCWNLFSDISQFWKIHIHVQMLMKSPTRVSFPQFPAISGPESWLPREVAQVCANYSK